MTALGINFRATSGYDTDDTDETYSLGEAYPTTRGGLTFGFGASLTANSRNRATAYAGKFAGIVFVANGGSTQTFTFELPFGPGTYRIRLAAGDATNAQASQKLVLMDGATAIATLTGSTSLNQWIDASSVVRTSNTDWQTNNVYAEHTFAGSALDIVLGNTGSGTTVIAHVSLEYMGGGSVVPLKTQHSRRR